MASSNVECAFDAIIKARSDRSRERLIWQALPLSHAGSLLVINVEKFVSLKETEEYRRL
jgi:hypothetical protein